jgi:hypothetical protein
MKTFAVRLAAAFVVFIASTAISGYILGKVAFELTPPHPPTHEGAQSQRDIDLADGYRAQVNSGVFPGPTMFSFLLGAALGGLFGVVAGRELLRHTDSN